MRTRKPKIKYQWYCELKHVSSVFVIPCKGCDKTCPNLIKTSYKRGISRTLREKIHERDKMCLACGTTKKLTIDHIIPVSSAKSTEDLLKLNEEENLITLCEKCNSIKGSRKLSVVFPQVIEHLNKK